MEGISALSNDKRCAVVTGGNRGIGPEVCRQLASNGIKVILTARNEGGGVKAVEELNASRLNDVIFHQLDVKDSVSIVRLVKFVESHFKKLNILVNNAAELGMVLYEEEFKAKGGFEGVSDENVHLLSTTIEQPYQMGEECLKTNYYGTKEVTEAFLPLLQLSNSPRIVNVTSVYGELRFFRNDKLKEELQDIDKITEEKIDEIIQWFLRDFKASKLQENGWPLTTAAYKVSKAVINAYTRLMARKFPNILINCVHPGYVITNMTAGTGFTTPEEGARAIVNVSLLPDTGPSGAYFFQMQEVPFDQQLYYFDQSDHHYNLKEYK